MEYGYVRVSTKEQNEARQLIALSEFGIEDDDIYIDKQSGSDFERKNYSKQSSVKIRESQILAF